MSEASRPVPTDSQWRHVEERLERFELAWKAGAPPRIDDFLMSSAGDFRSRLLVELVKLDLEYRASGAGAVRIEEYTDAYPELRSEAVWRDLLEEEVRVRRMHGTPVTAEELRSRFPDLGGIDELLTARGKPKSLETVAAAVDSTEPDGMPRPAHKPDRIGPYELGEQLGQGGFARVYRAWDAELERDVAIKISHAEYHADPAFRKRVLQEARSAARLHHPAIVPIHQTGEEAGQQYIVYDYVAGPTLEERMRPSPCAPEQAARWVMRIAEALDYAHQCGVVHRDIKPANILLDGDKPMIGDFGLARRSDVEATLTREGDILGTPAYMSPEQALGQGHAVDGRTDVYSLGVIFYELLAGRRPFVGDSVSVLHQVAYDEPARPGAVRRGIPRDLDTICMKAIAKSRERRYATAGEMAEDLRRALAHLPILARRLSPTERFFLWCRRRPALAGTIGVAMLLVAAVAAVGYWRVLRERDRYHHERDRALVDEATALMRARDTGWWWKAMDNLTEAARSQTASDQTSRLRELAIECMGCFHSCFRLRAAWSDHTEPVLALAMSPDGGLLASASRDKTIRIRDLRSGGSLAVLTGHDGAVTSVQFLSGSQAVVSAAGDGVVCLWDLRQVIAARVGDTPASLPPVVKLPLDAGAVHCLAISPDRRSLAAGCSTGKIVMLAASTESLATTFTWEAHSAAVTSLALAPSGSRLASGGRDGRIRFWDLADYEQVAVWNLQNPPITLSYSPDQVWLAWADAESFGFSWREIDTNKTVFRVQLHAGTVHQVHCPAGDMVLTASADGTLRMWVRHEFVELAVADGDSGAAYCLAASPEGRIVAAGYHDGSVRLWEHAFPPQRLLLAEDFHNALFLKSQQVLAGGLHHLGVVSYDLTTQTPWEDLPFGASSQRRLFTVPRICEMAVHPGSKRIVYGTDAGSLHIRDVAQRKELIHCSLPGHLATAVAPSPDGRCFASGSREGSVALWDWDSGTCQKVLESDLGAIHQVVWRDDAKALAAAGGNGAAAWILDADWKAIPISRERVEPPCVAFAAGGNLVLSTHDGGLDLRNGTTGQLLRRFESGKSPISALAVSPNRRILAATGANKLQLWKLDSEVDAPSTLEYAGSADPQWLAFDPQSRYLVGGSGRAHSPTHVWQVPTSREIATLFADLVPCGQFLPDGSAVLLGSTHGAIRSFAMRDVELAQADATQDPRVAVSGPAPITSFEQIKQGVHVDAVWGLAISPDDRWIATASHDRTVKIWDVQARELTWTLEGHPALVWCAAFSPDSRFLASGSTDIRIWEVATGRQVLTLSGHTRLVSSLAFWPGRNWLVSGSYDGSVRVWTLPRNLGDATTRFEVPSEQLPSRVIYRSEQIVHQIAIAPDRRRLAVGNGDRRVAVFEFSAAEDPVPLSPQPNFLDGHTGAVWSVGWSPDGSYLASGSERGVIILWDADSLERIVTLRGGTGQLRCLSFSHDGKLLAGAAYVKQTIVWDLHAVRAKLREMKLDW